MSTGGYTGHSEFVPEWDVYRDAEGKPVTITDDQLTAIWHAVHVVNAVRRSEKVNQLAEEAGFETNAYKSRLLGRMLIRGRPPTRTRPPIDWGGPSWNALPGGDPFEPSVIDNAIRTIIERGCDIFTEPRSCISERVAVHEICDPCLLAKSLQVLGG